jgi:prepilin peptidase CpaA
MAISLIAVLLVAGAAAITDARSGRIPNVLTLPLLVGAPLVHLLSSGRTEIFTSFEGIIACGIIPLILFCRGAMGGGDLKLLAAIGAALGPAAGLEVQTVAYVTAALYSAVILIRRGALIAVLASAARLVVRANASAASPDLGGEHPEGVNLGVFIFLGCVLSAARAAGGVA